MEYIRQKLRNWLAKNPNRANQLVAAVDSYQTPSMEATDQQAEFRFSIGKAINGKTITISKFKPNPHGPDWTHQLYLVPEGQDLMESIKTCMAITALTK